MALGLGVCRDAILLKLLSVFFVGVAATVASGLSLLSAVVARG